MRPLDLIRADIENGAPISPDDAIYLLRLLDSVMKALDGLYVNTMKRFNGVPIKREPSHG